jgi:formylglycine-generating enzyme required for sulfatase activity
LTDLLLDADPKPFALLYPRVEAQANEVLPVLAATVSLPLEEEKTQDAKEHLARRQANAAVLLLRLGQADRVWPLLKHPGRPQAKVHGFSDPRVRSYLIHRLGPLGADRAVLARRLDDVETDLSVRRALLLALGEFGPAQLTPAERERFLPGVVLLYRESADAGLHGAAEWLLRQWGQQETIRRFEQDWVKDEPRRRQREEQIRRDLAREPARGETFAGKSYWFLNGRGQTMVVIPGPVAFLIGSPTDEEGRGGGPDGKSEQQNYKRINRSFAIAAKEVTVGDIKDADFQKFYQEKVARGLGEVREYSPTAECAMNNVDWFDAAAYCNWLSAREGVPPEEWCYLPNDKGKYGPGMKPAPDYLRRTGYRLPSEAEWEYACRAGALTGRPYGEGEELLGKYAWYAANSLSRGMLPGRLLKPNDFGLFNMLGNAAEWCHDPFRPYTAGEDKEFEEGAIEFDNRVFRGGAFSLPASAVRSAYRDSGSPAIHYNPVAFRVARTLRLESSPLPDGRGSAGRAP